MRNPSSDEAKAMTCKTPEESAAFWADMSQKTQIVFQEHHKKGWRLWITKYQSYAKGAASFMVDLKPVLDIVQAAGVPYSGVAVGTVTALLTVRNNSFVAEAQSS